MVRKGSKIRCIHSYVNDRNFELQIGAIYTVENLLEIGDGLPPMYEVVEQPHKEVGIYYYISNSFELVEEPAIDLSNDKIIVL